MAGSMENVALTVIETFLEPDRRLGIEAWFWPKEDPLPTRTLFVIDGRPRIQLGDFVKPTGGSLVWIAIGEKQPIKLKMACAAFTLPPND